MACCLCFCGSLSQKGKFLVLWMPTWPLGQSCHCLSHLLFLSWLQVQSKTDFLSGEKLFGWLLWLSCFSRFFLAFFFVFLFSQQSACCPHGPGSIFSCPGPFSTIISLDWWSCIFFHFFGLLHFPFWLVPDAFCWVHLPFLGWGICLNLFYSWLTSQLSLPPLK